MLDLLHLLDTPGIDIQYFQGTTITQTWRKPRGCKWIYMLGVGGGSSGGCGANTGAAGGSGGGGGAGSAGAQTTLLIPASMVPDVLYIQAGIGGRQPAVLVTGALQVAGGTTTVSVEPYTTYNPALTLLYSVGGTAGVTGATSGSSGVGSTAAAASTLANMPLAAKGFTTFLTGTAGTNGGGSGVSLAVAAGGHMCMGGTGGGGTIGTSGSPGGAFTLTTAPIGSEFQFPVAASIGGVGATPAQNGTDGFICKYLIMNYGGTGGGSSSGTTAGSLPGGGGNGAPGSGGGGGGGTNVTNPTLGRPGNGGDGFVYMISF